MKVRKFCLCGVKLEREVSDEDQARKLVEMFRVEHSGEGHGPANAQEYRQVISKIVARNARSNQAKRPMPVISAIDRVGDLGTFGYCSVCLVVKSVAGHECKGAALILREPELVRVRK